MFSDDPATVRAITEYLAIAAWGYPAYGVAIVVSAGFNAVDRAGLALAQSAGRVILVMIPVAWLLRPGAGAQGVYAGELSANLAGGLVAALLAVRIFRGRSDNAGAHGAALPECPAPESRSE